MGSFLFDIAEFIALAFFLRAMVRSIVSRGNSSRIRVRMWENASPPPASTELQRGEMVRDPQCGMFVSTELSQKIQRRGETLHFCSRSCLEKYQEDAGHAASD